MRIQIGMLCAALSLAGCAHPTPAGKNPPPPDKKKPEKTYITPNLAIVGRVAMVNHEGRFVVLSFPAGRVPPAGEHWSLKHLGLKIGRVTITGPQQDSNTVADITEGEANVGDEAVAP